MLKVPRAMGKSPEVSRQTKGLNIVRRTTSGRPLLAGLAGVLTLALCVPAAVADPDPGSGGDTPSQAEVDAAKSAATNMKRTVASVQADLVMANQRLQEAGVKAGQAAEAYNAARWKLQEAQRAAAAADRRAAGAESRLEVQTVAYSDMVADNYEMSPEVTALSSMMKQDGSEAMLDDAHTMYTVDSSIEDITKAYDAAAKVAELASDQADDAHDAAAALEVEAESARAEAEAQEQAALSEASAVAAEKDSLIRELANLQDISVSLASRRQSALEAAAQLRAARAAQQAAVEDDAPATTTVDPTPTTTSDEPSDEPAPPTQDPEPSDPPSDEPAPPTQDPEPEPDPTPPPPSSSGAQAAINFARAQIGEPYVWAAAGPNSWDCSGLTMKAWAAGGKYLPHYSVGQYDTATPISSSNLRPGDLVFWGSSSSPSSIYHVALYVGNGQMIHAPRTGRDVTQESMYYWIPPNFYARP